MPRRLYAWACSRPRAKTRPRLRPRGAAALLLALVACFSAARAFAEEPALPPGLADPPPPAKKSDEPSLPPGLGEPPPAKKDEPALPSGLGEPVAPPAAKPGEKPPEAKKSPLPFDLTGFWELRGGVRTQNDPHEKGASLGESRLHLQADKAVGETSFRVTGDLLYDMVETNPRVDLEEGRGVFDLREAYVSLRPVPFMDIKIGRQVLTWGTGDLVFINDLFPKDFNAFFIGRDVEYLKAPSDALKVSFFSDAANLDVVYTPRFDADRFIDGRRLSYFNPLLGRQAGRDAVVDPETPAAWFKDDELALRLYRNIGAVEVAAYGYHGFWKDPVGFDPVRRRATFPDLAVYGASVRGPLGKGIGHMEAGYYDSMDDRPGDNPFVPNSQVRFLAGYEQDLAQDFTAGVQYYLERTTDFDALRRTAPAGQPQPDENRHLLTLRLTRLLWNQNLELSLFTFYSPSDNDAHLRPHAKYKIDDHWSVEGGANVFFGSQQHTFFGQFENNSNVYVGVRYSF